MAFEKLVGDLFFFFSNYLLLLLQSTDNPGDCCGSLCAYCCQKRLEFSLVGCSDGPLLGLLCGSLVVLWRTWVKLLAWEHVRGFGRVASVLVALPSQRSLVHKYPPQVAA